LENDSLSPSSYEEYVRIFDALSHPMRIKIIGILLQKRRYVSELAKLVSMSRPLLYMHLKKLEEAGFVEGTYEISESGKTMRFYELKSFDIRLTPQMLGELARGIESGM